MVKFLIKMLVVSVMCIIFFALGGKGETGCSVSLKKGEGKVYLSLTLPKPKPAKPAKPAKPSKPSWLAKIIK